MLELSERVVSVWLGRIRSRDGLDDYVARRSGIPMSDFARDLGVDEFEDICSHRTRADDPEELAQILATEPHAESFMAEVRRRATALRLTRANAAILLYDHAYVGESWPRESPLRFVGNFPYESNEPLRTASDHRARVEAISVTSDGRRAVT